MKMSRSFLLSAALFSVLTAGFVFAADKEETEPAPVAVNLFDAIEKGLVEVKMTPKSALEGNIAIKNVSDMPLQIDRPNAFAGVPILAQGPFGPGGMQGGPGMGPGGMGMGQNGMGMGMGPGMGPGGMNNQRGNNNGRLGGNRPGGNSFSSSSSSGGNQSVGGGMSGNRGGMGGGWLIAPEKTVREKVRTVCLEHGKKDPRSGSEYAIVPISNVTENKTTQALCEMLGNEDVDQQSVQAAVWNKECGVSYEDLNAKVYQPSGNVTPRPWFTKDQLANSENLIATAEKRAAEMEKEEAEAKKAADIAEEEAILNETQTEDSKPDTVIEDLTRDLTK